MTHQETMQENFSLYYELNYTYDDHLIPLEEHLPHFSVITTVCYIIIICISLPGNSFLLWFLKQDRMKSSADWLLLHLTASDLIFTLTLVPWTIDHICGWIFGEVGCRLFNWGIFLGLYSYITFLTVMTIHRYVVIVHPVFATSTGNRFRLYTHVSSAVVWMISVGFSLPEAYFCQTTYTPDGISCVPVYNSQLTEVLAYFIMIILFFTLPFLIIAFCYARMAFAIHKSHITRRNRHNAVCIIFSTVVGFFICWAPYNIFLFLYVLKLLGVSPLTESAWDETWEHVFFNTHILAYSHCCLNPLIHILGGKKFRRHLPCFRGFTWSSQRYQRHTFSNQSSLSGQTYL